MICTSCMKCMKCMKCSNNNNIVNFLFYNYEDGIKQIEEYYSNKFNIKIKIIGNNRIKNKNYFILCDINKSIDLHIRYKIINSFFGEKFLIYDNDYFINASV